jgi:hypothetical protein
MKSKRYNIVRGLTFFGAISFIGLLIFISGILLVFKNIIFGICLLLTGLSLFLQIKGSIIDQEKKIIKPYTYFLIFRITKKFDLKKFNSLSIKTEKESVRMNSRGTSSDYHVRSYNVYLENKTGNSKILLKSFISMEKAKDFKKEIYDIINDLNV